jgi:hypothetical protein
MNIPDHIYEIGETAALGKAETFFHSDILIIPFEMQKCRASGRVVDPH